MHRFVLVALLSAASVVTASAQGIESRAASVTAYALKVCPKAADQPQCLVDFASVIKDAQEVDGLEKAHKRRHPAHVGSVDVSLRVGANFTLWNNAISKHGRW